MMGNMPAPMAMSASARRANGEKWHATSDWQRPQDAGFISATYRPERVSNW